MSNGNRLSIPELEDQIAALSAQLRSQQQRAPAIHWYTCPRCSSFYTSIWGCGCPLFPGEKRQTAAGVATVAPVSVMSAAFLWTNQRKDEKNGQPFTYRDLEDAFEAGAACSVPASNFKHCEQCTGWHARCRETKQCQIACGVALPDGAKNG